tara:strand:- start:3817 stop:5730 length:1914 start_codon:yes stop_codon:yes gene_type:complete
MILRLANILISLSRFQKLSLAILVDVISMFLVWMIFGPPLASAMSQNFNINFLSLMSSEYLQLIIPMTLTLGFLVISGFYKSMIRFYDLLDTFFISISGSLIFGFTWLLTYVSTLPNISYEIFFIFILQAIMLSVVLFSFLSSSRIFAKYILFSLKNVNSDAIPIIIYGAGSAGKELFEALQFDKSKRILGFFDDSNQFKHRLINNIPIYTSFKKLKALKDSQSNLNVLLAIPSLDLNHRREIIAKLEKLKIAVRTVPAFHELVFDQKKMSDIQSLSIDDLIPGREIEDLNISDAKNREFLITGAGGSIGSEIVRQILAHNPKKIILFDISEFNLFKIFEEVKITKSQNNLSTEILSILGNILDSVHLRRIFEENNIQTIYHAAAYKHVPLVQDIHNISKSLENNFLGTYKLGIESAKANVDSFVLVSTDKAVRPTNVMGASKRMAEIAIQVLNKKNPHIKFSMVRFGNVINSSGSVIPLFLEQISRGGPLTITHKEVERYFMTIPEASSLVIQAGEMSTGGEVFILDMGKQMKVLDIAKRLIHLSGRSVAEDSESEGIEIEEIGLRDGEKMFEELLISGDEQETRNKRIVMSNEKFLNINLFDDILESFKIAISNNDIDSIINLMEKHVDGFTYQK